MNLFGKIWRNTDQITKWLQILALGIAAYWAYTKFQLGEAPSLKPNAWVTSNLSSEDAPFAGGCYAEFRVSVQNVGKVEFDVKRVRIRAWRVDGPRTVSDSLKDGYFDIDNVQAGTPEFDRTFDSGNLTKHYLPDNESTQTYTWIVHRTSAAIYLFRADVGDENSFFPDYGRAWRDDVCVKAVSAR
ncbi:MAG TPA: hypothetical protein VFT65_07300 [Candidatus Angelobacter sp.]|nr:hypothetical protein [Candidatus Angelobacter sp.]